MDRGPSHPHLIWHKGWASPPENQRTHELWVLWKASGPVYLVTVKVLLLLFWKNALKTTFPVVAAAGTCT